MLSDTLTLSETFILTDVVFLARFRSIRITLALVPPFLVTEIAEGLPDLILTLAQRAVTAFLALWLRCAGVNLAARAGPPFNPPLRPSATAAVFLLFMSRLYVSGHE